MNRRARFVAAVWLAALSGTGHAQAPPAPAPAGITGLVLSPDARSVTDGTVTFKALGGETVAGIGRDGRFHTNSLPPGSYEVQVSSPGLMARSLRLTLIPSRSVLLPPIQLSPAAYVRLKLVTPAGEPVTGASVVRSSFQLNGTMLSDRATDRRPELAHEDGAISVGPLPRGITMMAVDAVSMARTRLKDVRVTGESALIDGGQVVVEPPTTLRVRVVNRRGEPVRAHPVSLDDGMVMTPIRFEPTRTDVDGVATFYRLAAGTYRLRLPGPESCGGFPWPVVQRLVKVPRGGTTEELVVLDAVQIALRFAFGGTPLAIASAAITPEVTPLAMPAWLRNPDPLLASRARAFAGLYESPCPGFPERSGRFTFTNVPSGRARVDVRLGGTTWTRKLVVPPNGGEITLQIRAGMAPLRIIDSARAPVGGAIVMWQSGGTQVEAATPVSGEVLMQGIPDGTARMTVSSSGFQSLARNMAAPPEVLEEVVLERIPQATLSCRVRDETGQPIAGAVVELTPANLLEDPSVGIADAAGLVRFMGLSPGMARVRATAHGNVPAIEAVKIGKTDGEIAVTLARGYRIVATVQPTLSLEGNPFEVRVLNGAGAEVNGGLDAIADRIIERPGRASLGPLAPGVYTVELRGGSDPRRQEIRIIDRDVEVVFR